MRLSVLVISRIPRLLNQMLRSLSEAICLHGTDVEIICSWNGSKDEENEIINSSGYEFLIAQRSPYHFASNMNELAKKANGELLLLINDDVILDEGSIDNAIACIEEETQAGLIGGKLRDESGNLTHAGILFDSRHSPYHQFDKLLKSNEEFINKQKLKVPAVTGALILIRKKDFLQLNFNESYKVCGEDVELCLDIQQKLKLFVFYCSDFSGIHEAESTRKNEDNQKGNSEDLARMRMLRRLFIEKATKEQIQNELYLASLESEILRSMKIKVLEEDLIHWKDQSHSLQLVRLRQLQDIEGLKNKLSQSQQ